MRTRGLGLAPVLLALGGCAGDEPGPALPDGVGSLPGNTVFVLQGPLAAALPEPGTLDPAGFAGRALAALRSGPSGAGPSDSGPPALRHALAGQVATGWAGLGASRSFREAFAARPPLAAEPGASWAYLDLQLLLDELLARAGEPRLAALVEPLGLRSLDWLIAGLRDGRGEVGEAVVRARQGDGGLAAVLAGPAGPSLLGAPGEGERLRIELRVEVAAARRTLDAWLAAEGSTGISARNAAAGLAAGVGRELLDLLDGRLSAVLDADGAWTAALGLREPDDARDLLDRFFEPDGADRWIGPDGALLRVDGARLLLVPAADAAVPAAGGPEIAALLRIDCADLAAFAPWAGAGAGHFELRRTDRETLRATLRLAD
jgi:hypothetical protein